MLTRSQSRTLLSTTILVTAAAVLAGCPKDEGKRNATATPMATASGGAATATTSGAMASPTATTGSSATGPSHLPAPSPTMFPTPAAPDESPAKKGETVIQYRWGGGFSIFQYYAVTIRGTKTAKVSFVVKPVRDTEKHVEDTLDEKQFDELKALFDKVGFDKVGEKARGVRIMDIGQIVVSREGDGHEKHEVVENGQTMADADIAPLRLWFDAHVRGWMDKAGVGLKKKPAPTEK